LPEKYSEENAPLLGVPFSCKECIWVQDMPNTSGWAISTIFEILFKDKIQFYHFWSNTGLHLRKEVRAPEDAVVVKNMRNAGAILLGTTNTSELCMWFESGNHVYGITKNPYNLSRFIFINRNIGEKLI